MLFFVLPRLGEKAEEGRWKELTLALDNLGSFGSCPSLILHPEYKCRAQFQASKPTSISKTTIATPSLSSP
jgi:hypothetical protein